MQEKVCNAAGALAATVIPRRKGRLGQAGAELSGPKQKEGPVFDTTKQMPMPVGGKGSCTRET